MTGIARSSSWSHLLPWHREQAFPQFAQAFVDLLRGPALPRGPAGEHLHLLGRVVGRPPQFLQARLRVGGQSGQLTALPAPGLQLVDPHQGPPHGQEPVQALFEHSPALPFTSPFLPNRPQFLLGRRLAGHLVPQEPVAFQRLAQPFVQLPELGLEGARTGTSAPVGAPEPRGLVLEFGGHRPGGAQIGSGHRPHEAVLHQLPACALQPRQLRECERVHLPEDDPCHVARGGQRAVADILRMSVDRQRAAPRRQEAPVQFLGCAIVQPNDRPALRITAGPRRVGVPVAGGGPKTVK